MSSLAQAETEAAVNMDAELAASLARNQEMFETIQELKVHTHRTEHGLIGTDVLQSLIQSQMVLQPYSLPSYTALQSQLVLVLQLEGKD